MSPLLFVYAVGVALSLGLGLVMYIGDIQTTEKERRNGARLILASPVWLLAGLAFLASKVPAVWRTAFPKAEPAPLTHPTADELAEVLTHGLADEPTEPRTFVVAPTRARAVAWCQENGVHPRGKDTVILSGRLSDIDRAIRGHQFRSADRIVYLAKRTPELVEILSPAFATLRLDARPLEVDAS